MLNPISKQPAPLAKQPALSVDQANGPAADAQEVRQAFTSFVGETFFAQMISAMRTSVGKPAYFHGGQGEEIFRGQLDQQLAQEMTKASADKFSEPLFRHQFPQLAETIRQYEAQQAPQAAAAFSVSG